MSYEPHDTYSVYNETDRRARKEHTCSACRTHIAPGEQFTRVVAIYDGSVTSLKRCACCQTLHEHLRELAPGDMWPDEELDCGQDYVDEWGALPGYVAALAFANWQEAAAIRAWQNAQGELASCRRWERWVRSGAHHPVCSVTNANHHTLLAEQRLAEAERAVRELGLGVVT